MSYTHLTQEERYVIYAGLQRADSASQIAADLGRDVRTIEREIVRNTGQRGYRPLQAQRLAAERRSEAQSVPKKIVGQWRDLVLEKLSLRWSPEQIAGWLRGQGFTISFQSLYRFIHHHARDCIGLLRHRGKKYRRAREHRGRIKNRRDIDERPEIVESKTRFGDWEADLIVGAKHQGAVVTLVERTSKYTLMARISNREAATVSATITRLLNKIKTHVFTLTIDNGKEFAAHESIGKTLECDVFFAKPYAVWQKGLVEHTNGLIRDYFPKTTNFLTLSKQEIKTVQNQLNNRPRKVLNYQSPTEIFNAHIAPAIHT